MRNVYLGRFWSLILAAAVAVTSVTVAPTRALAADPLFTFNGGGWGHGIGLSQYGARGYALKGWKYDAILRHYYQGTKLVTRAEPKVKVNIDDTSGSRSRWKIRSGTDSQLTVALETDSTDRIVLSATASYWITTSAGKTSVRADASGAPGATLKTFNGACFAFSGGLVQVLDASGPFNHTGVRWRGTIHFKPVSATANTSRAVNYVMLEQYLYGVVPRESPSSWPAEALKAQAVAARSYAYQNAVDGDILHCTTMSQVYNGHSRPGYSHEPASTNAAIDATRGQLVWYGSETRPVRTYFSSSSGGHTANVEDVWIGSTPKPYYKGVVDADQASPHFTWKAGPYSGTYVASKLRDRDNGSDNRQPLDYSAPAPATVTAITTERATSGFTHHATVTWSNGAKYRIQGDTLRGALGMRSTKFGVTRTYPVEDKTRFQQSDSRIAWTGPWKDISKTALSGGSVRYSSTAGSMMIAAFNGNGITLVGTRGPLYGKARVYVDRAYAGTIDLYSSTTKYKQTLFSVSNLAPGSHLFEVKALGTRNKAAKGSIVAVDALDVINGALASTATPVKRFEQTATEFAALGAWKTASDSSFSAGSQGYSVEGGAKFYATFYGSGVRWVGSRGVNYGQARVSVDGAAPTLVDLTSATTLRQQVLYSTSGLSRDRTHTLCIEVLPPRVGHVDYVAIDAIDVVGGWVVPAQVPAVTVQESDPSILWGGTWGTTRSSLLSGGAHRWSSTRSSMATITFEGTQITWIGKKARHYGKSRVYLDGRYVVTIDQYASASLYKQRLWTSPRLAAGKHTLEIKVLGTKATKATGVTVGVDAFEIRGRIPR